MLRQAVKGGHTNHWGKLFLITFDQKRINIGIACNELTQSTDHFELRLTERIQLINQSQNYDV